ncbi:hypothetical protein [Dickeya chrysanthemi]|uniref:hypothetical protein n=1 Tax=Dickeya chrysanthemi TaxID=556 RepID=UPI001CF51C34|nr:hypothetical protein [Dickeya chrysanthemi]MCA7008854.1 hypothetical protein [Dickeya chrysanthemi]
MPDQIPTLNATLNVSPDFTGRVLVYVENGRATNDRQLFDDEHVACLDTFLELARRAGWHVVPPGEANA